MGYRRLWCVLLRGFVPRRRPAAADQVLLAIHSHSEPGTLVGHQEGMGHTLRGSRDRCREL